MYTGPYTGKSGYKIIQYVNNTLKIDIIKLLQFIKTETKYF
jgi:hypothetical protein